MTEYHSHYLAVPTCCVHVRICYAFVQCAQFSWCAIKWFVDLPRPRLVALNAAAALLGEREFAHSFYPATNVFAHLFCKHASCDAGESGVCVLWNNVSSVNISLRIARTSLAVFDTMGNGRDTEAIALGRPGQEAESVTLTLQAERPVFLRADGFALRDALSTMQITPLFPATVSVSKRSGVFLQTYAIIFTLMCSY